MPQETSDHDASGAPVVIPPLELQGSLADRLRALDESIGRLQQLKSSLTGETAFCQPPSELHGPYLHAPVWPWFLAGWIVGALFVLMFVFARALA